MAELPLILKLIFIFLYTIQPIWTPTSAYEASYENLGIPLSSYYSEGVTARTAWDVEIYDGKLFVAAGDYDANSGPVPLYHYDLETETWGGGDLVQDEQVENFYIIGDKLMAPGSDPRQDWTYGNLYQYENGTWETYRTIPGGIHQLDLVEFEGKLFVGLGVAAGEYPIAVSEDGGQTFTQVPMYKDSAPLDTSANGSASLQIRVYDFFIYQNTLYAFYLRNDGTEVTMELYRYDNGAFYYYSNLPRTLSFRRISYQAFSAQAEFDNTMYFTTGVLYASTDMKTATPVNFGKNARVTDLRVIENRLYACVISPTEDGTYRTSLWCKAEGSQLFRELLYFTFPSPAQSFTYNHGIFYFGMGEGTISKRNDTNGTILKVSYPIQ